ncbi:hypothetical protein GCM10023232_06270 [Sphingosinicella ginsenosidimutans]|uniref:DUF3618 domain-containing protein n=1 Tax=Allosphingosinicella ginsenosidimutans TaxID=1176539 RepID=A0A5C6TXG9_9SPHN|nr:DUF3618 domain-containing protein [Sphingosinicella ginsenosidimutans]TXC64468.1 DUF3618 domain-containing protein [Sphingosinicella ginsenosidimutans]
MSASDIQTARRAAILARARLDATLAETQQRLRPGNLAGEAWDGAKGKAADKAVEAFEAAKARPAATATAAGAIALFLARGPLIRAAGRLLGGKKTRRSQ